MKKQLLQKSEKLIAVCLLLFGVVYLYLARDMPFGAWNSPKTGFMPKVAGSMMVFFAVINLIVEMKKPDAVPEELENVNWLKAILYIGTCALYVALLSWGLGYLFSTLLCTIMLIKFTGIKGWKLPLITAILVTFFFYGVFHLIMGVYLPRFTLF